MRLRLLDGFQSGYYLDIFRNYEKIANIKAPATSLLNWLRNECCGRRRKRRHEETEVAIMHGTDDEVVPFSNGEAWIVERRFRDYIDC